LAFENNQKGTPLMRPLFFDEPENEALFEQTTGYFWGSDFLIYPVLQPNETSKSVYFPKGNDWVDFYSHQIFEGGSSQNIKVVETNIPTFVKKGAIIPMLKTVANAENTNFNALEIHIYYNENAEDEKEQNVYFDNGNTKEAFEKGQYELMTFETENEKKHFEIDIETEIGTAYKSSEKELTFAIHLFPKKPKNIKLNGKKLRFVYDETTKTLTFETQFLKEKQEIKKRRSKSRTTRKKSGGKKSTGMTRGRGITKDWPIQVNVEVHKRTEDGRTVSTAAARRRRRRQAPSQPRCRPMPNPRASRAWRARAQRRARWHPSERCAAHRHPRPASHLPEISDAAETRPPSGCGGTVLRSRQCHPPDNAPPRVHRRRATHIQRPTCRSPAPR
jgi:hypothetical protein